MLAESARRSDEPSSGLVSMAADHRQLEFFELSNRRRTQLDLQIDDGKLGACVPARSHGQAAPANGSKRRPHRATMLLQKNQRLGSESAFIDAPARASRPSDRSFTASRPVLQ